MRLFLRPVDASGGRSQVSRPQASWMGLAGGVLSVVVVLLGAPALHAQLGRATRPQVTPPQGPVRKVIFTHCVSCHGIDDYAYNALDRQGWDTLMTAKHRGLTMTITAPDRSVLLDWLMERFGPGSKPFPRTYVAQEVTTFLSDPEGEGLLKRACTSCHGIDRVNSARFSPERWRVVTVDMRERGARLEDDELERLVEWLGRVKGTNDSDRQ